MRLVQAGLRPQSTCVLASTQAFMLASFPGPLPSFLVALHKGRDLGMRLVQAGLRPLSTCVLAWTQALVCAVHDKGRGGGEAHIPHWYLHVWYCSVCVSLNNCLPYCR